MLPDREPPADTTSPARGPAPVRRASAQPTRRIEVRAEDGAERGDPGRVPIAAFRARRNGRNIIQLAVNEEGVEFDLAPPRSDPLAALGLFGIRRQPDPLGGMPRANDSPDQ